MSEAEVVVDIRGVARRSENIPVPPPIPEGPPETHATAMVFRNGGYALTRGMAYVVPRVYTPVVVAVSLMERDGDLILDRTLKNLVMRDFGTFVEVFELTERDTDVLLDRNLNTLILRT